MKSVKGMLRLSREIKEFILTNKDFDQQAAEIDDAVNKWMWLAIEQRQKSPELCLIADALFATIQDAICEADRLRDEFEKRRKDKCESTKL
jgi:hypothetical protein